MPSWPSKRTSTPRAVHQVHVIGVHQPQRVPVLGLVGDQAYRHAAGQRAQHRVGDGLVGDAEHLHVDLRRLGVVGGHGAIAVALVRRKVQLGIDRIDREVARSRTDDVGVIDELRGR